MPVSGIGGHAFIDLERYVDLPALEALDDEITYGLTQVPLDYTGGSHKTMGIVPPSLAEEPYADYGQVIARFSREEFVRFASPVMTFRRTATRDTVLGDQEIREGEWVAMVYSSGNRDERVFVDPYRFDITRNPNPHVGFGGRGPHFCLGNFLAKMQFREIFGQLLYRAPDLRVGEPDYLVGNFVRAVKSMPFTTR